jgi:hypothetical protein
MFPRQQKDTTAATNTHAIIDYTSILEAVFSIKSMAAVKHTTVQVTRLPL